MKLRQKTYLLTLMLFVVCISASFILMLQISENTTYQAETDKHLLEQHTIALALSNDAASVMLRKPTALNALAESYVSNYKNSGVMMSITNDSEIIASTLPVPQSDVPTAPQVGQRLHTVVNSGEKSYLIVTARLPSPDTMVITCAFDITDIYTNSEILVSIGVVIIIIAVIVLAIALYFILKQISRPIEKLAQAAKEIASGNYNAKSDIKTQDEVGQLAATFNHMAQSVRDNVHRLEQSAQEKQVLFDTLAHEIRTPLTAVSGYAQYIRDANVSEEDKYESLNYIIDESKRLSAMCSRILQMAALRGEKARFDDVDMCEVLNNAQKTLRPKALAHSIKIMFRCEGNCTVKGEKLLLESLVANLAENAINSCRKGDSVEITALRLEESVYIIVKDTGHGMDKETLEHLGEYFYRPDKARSRKHGGAGLGVALCRQIVESHSGEIIFESAINKGTTVTVWLEAV